MVRLLKSSDKNACLNLWNETMPDRFEIDSRLLDLNLFENSLAVPEGAWAYDIGVALGGFAFLKRAPEGLYPDVPTHQLHLEALVGRSEAALDALLEAAISKARKLGAIRLVYGQGLRHFWPGVPAGDVLIAPALIRHGFVGGDLCVDLERDLEGYSIPAGVMERANPAAEFRVCTREDIPALEEFLKRAFPRRWWYDTMDKIRTEGDPSFIMTVFVDGKCEGFALTHDWNSKAPIGGAVWHVSMGDHWGSLGPIGVSEEVRGQGLGNAILAFGLDTLRARGVRQCIIDWTTLIEFYGIHGFLPTRRYTPYSLDLTV